jgi:hypothetical protein
MGISEVHTTLLKIIDTPKKYSWYLFLLEAVSAIGLYCGQEDYVNEKL